jgi:flavin reductase (DIM6/NTAB) family NADH-FMN oxidoreductase RutF
VSRSPVRTFISNEVRVWLTFKIANEFQLFARCSGAATANRSEGRVVRLPSWTTNWRVATKRNSSLFCGTQQIALAMSSSAVGPSGVFRFHSRPQLSSSAKGQDGRPAEQSDTRLEVKHLMRRVPYPVAIVTATDVNAVPQGGPDAWRGATVSSFNTVAIEPSVIISFNIKQLSSTLEAIRHSGKFRIHLLEENQEAVELARRFTKGNATAPFRDICNHVNKPDQGSVLSTKPNNALEPPLLQPVSFHLVCRLLKDKIVEIGDHVVVFGVVQEVGQMVPDALSNPNVLARTCLVYADGDYRRVHNLKSATNASTLLMESCLPVRTNNIRSPSPLATPSPSISRSASNV